MLRIDIYSSFLFRTGLVIFVIHSFIGNPCSSQDIHFAQFSETPLLINPALTGEYDGFYRGILNYRNQWPAMGKAFNSMMGSFDMPLERKKKKGSCIGLGGLFFSDKGGDSRFGSTQAKVSVSSILPTNAEGKFSAGLQLGFAQHNLDISSIQWPNQYDGYQYNANIAPNEQLDKVAFKYLDVGAGIAYFKSRTVSSFSGSKQVHKTSLGLSFSHASMPLQKFYPGSKEKQYPRIVAHATLRRDIKNSRIGIVPSLVGMLQGPACEIFFGGLVRYKINEGTKMTNFYSESAFSGGLFYRFKDAISTQILYEFSDYAIGISYDINASSYGEVQKSAGGFEISIRYANMRGALLKNSGIGN